MVPFYIFYKDTEATLINEIKINAKSISGTIAVMIQRDIEPYRSLYNAKEYNEGSYDERYYQEMLEVFQDLKQKTEASFIYTEKLVADDYIIYILDAENPESEDFSHIGSRDSMGYIEYESYKTKTSMATDIINDPYWGDYITGLSPIIDGDTSEVLGLVGVDFSADYISSHLSDLKYFLYLVYLFFACLLFLFYNTVVEKINKGLRLDYLTGLYNRKSVDKRLGYLIKRGGALSVAIIDVDNFKYINDTFGHFYGDFVLKRAAHLISTSIKNTDMASRYGGDEFVIIFKNTDIEGAVNACSRLIMKTHSDEVKVDTNDFIKFSLSIGIAELKNNHTSAKELLKMADSALLKAKENGKNQFMIYEE
jgi:diguanylate cyclase (GGDEF)-like protein